MKPVELLREIAYPLTEMTVLLAILVFGSLAWLAHAAGILGLWLAFIIVPAIFRYGVYILESRAHGRNVEAAGIEVFNIADNFWGIFPMILLGAFAGLEFYLAYNVSATAAEWLLVVFFIVYPASMAVLVITRSPVDSVNPAILLRMIRTCGVNYVSIPLVLTIVMIALLVLVRNLLPGFSVHYLGVYLFYLLFTVTGAVVHESGATAEVDIEPPLARSAADIAADVMAARQRVINHAYGFISRGNREGGFMHVRQSIAADPDPDGAVAWYFNEMMKWEMKQAALFFGQECLAHFLHHEQDAPALKVMSRCLYEDPQWKPRPDDRDAVFELARRHGRDDLVRSLGHSAHGGS